ncbi:cytidylate kinase [Thermosipho melanesiensis]|uniref:Cytidylate kinase n=2 Tax=Thermosipho melanesiensis TaxID=46541 RepID=KCY_THEM4|nr:(d)CMP kinase [Thermosipho melanesiensis]A6LNG5.1 RecName: Full=Cytidylate kinase; Short=CK; AltName: Full=Cytidine monophosphate kinase; Short=CMP kinase [Thermosipho melanesiensis BI429]ABR31466.1 cytidylate kinase [Thermosipho melanesiensis BI429]APT74524.1 cytidylate kinase [Thermosipho melanesiensis]OOC36476.1 cytidylate kinase [Thermosipho melanesiensis]OOC37294.1 cytidylate kinase [Thermosipho melanesiensis]OOC38047.1 cytidylate kinase [Thermosipho melanesiensis]
MPCRIAIDGPAGSGKTTVAKLLADALGIFYLDTGAMYRIVGLYLSENNVESDEEIERKLKELKITFSNGNFFLNGRKIGNEIRTPEIGIYASKYAKRLPVRNYLTKIQREIAKNQSIVVEGRDIGTVVLPDAEVKIFLVASQEARAKRRYKELMEKGVEVTFEEVLSEIVLRDKQDSERDVAPLKKAKDAILIDTTNLSIEEVIERILKVVKEKCKL